jgi:hypothetical protein
MLRNIPKFLASQRSRAWFFALVLAALTIFGYRPAWNGGFVWDDDVYITSNELLTAPDGLRRIWFSLDSPSQYFPLVYSTFTKYKAFYPESVYLSTVIKNLETAGPLSAYSRVRE